MFISNSLFNEVSYPPIPETVRSQVFVGFCCNYKCVFCYYKDKLNIKNDYNTVIKQMDLIQKHNILDIEFTGGEPTIDKNWFGYLKEGKKRFRHLSVITNGAKFSDISFLRKSFSCGLREVLFSLHGYDSESHDKITGVKGSWKKIIKAIENAKNLGFIVRINCTVCSDNYNKLDRLAMRVKEIRPLGMNFIPLNYWDGGASSSSPVSYLDMSRFIKQAIDILKGHIRYLNVRYIPYCFMRGYEGYVCSWHSHSFDYWDWNNKFKVLPNLDISLEDTSSQVNLIRSSLFAKSKDCLKCKHRYICDGVEKPLVCSTSLIPEDGETIKDILHYRKEYCSIEEYHRVINDRL